MDKEEVNVVQSESLQGVINGPLDVLGTVEVIPDFSADEDVFPLDGGVLLEEVMDTITNLILVEVEPGTVQVTVSGLEGLGDSLVGLALGALTGEGTETDTGDLNAIAQRESLSVRHVGWL